MSKLDEVTYVVDGVEFVFVRTQMPNGDIMEIQKYPMTQAQYRALTGKDPSHFKGDQNPVESVNWYESVEAGKLLSEKTGREGFRLPTEEEWVWAAKAGDDFEWAGSNNPDEVAWHDGNSGGSTHPVGQLKPNGWGIYDMSGNALLARTAEPHWRFLRRAMADVLRRAAAPREIWRQHAAIVEAIVDGDGARAATLAVEHDHRAAAMLRAALGGGTGAGTPGGTR